MRKMNLKVAWVVSSIYIAAMCGGFILASVWGKPWFMVACGVSGFVSFAYGFALIEIKYLRDMLVIEEDYNRSLRKLLKEVLGDNTDSSRT